MNLAIIPARTGSVRIRDKNKKLFFGRPIIEYTIIACQKSSLINDLVIFTDDSDIEYLAQRWGLTFIEQENATADTILYTQIIQAIEKYTNKYEKPNKILIAYPCAPFITPWRINEGYNILINMHEYYDTVFPVIKNDTTLEYLLILEKGLIKPLFGERAQVNAPQGRQIFKHVSQWFWCNVNALYENKTIIKEGRIGYLEIPWIEGQDIDIISDWGIAEMKYRLWRGMN